MNKKLKTFAAAVVLLAVLAAGLVYWAPWKTQGPGEGFVSGNGRIEATEVAVATKVTIPRQSRGHSGCEPLKAAVRGR